MGDNSTSEQRKQGVLFYNRVFETQTVLDIEDEHGPAVLIAGPTYTEIVESPYGLHLNVKDPDEIPIEFFVPAQG